VALVPKQEHGTHVGGTIAGERRKSDHQPAPKEVLEGMCPNLELYDFRVFDDKGRWDECSILAALQFIRFLNSSKDQPAVHGVNLSLSIRHDAADFACGSTPVCGECERYFQGAGLVDVLRAHRSV
jgi:serine protease AprX